MSWGGPAFSSGHLAVPADLARATELVAGQQGVEVRQSFGQEHDLAVHHGAAREAVQAGQFRVALLVLRPVAVNPYASSDRLAHCLGQCLLG